MTAPDEWVQGHRGYDDPGSPQARRLATVQRLAAAVGAHRLVAAPREFVAGRRLFTFLVENKRPSRSAL